MGDVTDAGGQQANAPAAKPVDQALPVDTSMNGIAQDVGVMNARLTVLEGRFDSFASLASAITSIQSTLANHGVNLAGAMEAVSTVGNIVGTIQNDFAEVRGLVSEVATKVNAYAVGNNNATAGHDGRISWIESVIERVTGQSSPAKIEAAKPVDTVTGA